MLEGTRHRTVRFMRVCALLRAPLVCWQPSYHLCHLLIRVDPEALVLGHTRQLHVLAVQLLLHDLLQCLEYEHLSLGQGERLVELVLQLCLCAL